MLKETLEAAGYQTIISGDGQEGIKRFKDERIDLVITDLKLPKKDGLAVLSAVKEENPLIPVIIMTAYGTIDIAVKAIKDGAFEFITKPFDTDHLLHLIKKALQNQRLIKENMLLKEEFSSRLGMPTIIGKSERIIEAAKKAQKVARTKTTVLLLGESGTGKELFARAIHCLSPRKDFPFVPINCAAIPKELLESELFGYEKGAFTGAETRKIGKIELADKGTVFFDEIGEMDITLQSKLMRVLQEGEIEKVGGLKTSRVDVRIIAATNRDIEKAVREGRFREDLYYRLNVFPITLPPLRDRVEDIPLLVDYFIEKYSAEMKVPQKVISKEAIARLINYEWKGNVRELENTIERAMILCDDNIIGPEHIVLSPVGYSDEFDVLSLEGSLEDAAKEALRIVETRRIKKALAETKGNKSRAAEILNVSYKTLLTKIKEYGIE